MNPVFSFVGCLVKSRNSVHAYSVGIVITLLLSIASGSYYLWILFHENSETVISDCLNGGSNSISESVCKNGINVYKGLTVAVYIVIWLFMIYAYVIVDNYVEQLDDEMSVKETRQMINSISRPQVTVTPVAVPAYASYPASQAPPGSAYTFSQSNQSYGVQRRNNSMVIWTESTTTVVLKGLHFRIQTTAWNLTHDILSTYLGTSQKSRLRRVLKQFYDLGSVVCLMGMLTALGFLVTTGMTSAVSLAHKLWLSTSDPPDIRDVLAKRSVDLGSTETESGDSFIKPIIPGVTVPLGHLPVILAAVFLIQLVHELGHAFAAAIAALDSLVPRARARVVAAGPFHNLLLWGILVAVGYTHVGSIFWFVGYRDVSALGRVVVRVDTVNLNSMSPSLYGLK
ncbi:hypothetical protein C0993_006302 [Termitomyces sp. T159_Od127]|nr:hypothetical protein C0993_006302 [Termitomyces sp. T159_Od127]